MVGVEGLTNGYRESSQNKDLLGMQAMHKVSTQDQDDTKMRAGISNPNEEQSSAFWKIGVIDVFKYFILFIISLESLEAPAGEYRKTSMWNSVVETRD